MFALLLLIYCFIFIPVLLLCCVSRLSLYCNIPSDLCPLSLSCYYFYIVLSLYLYCCYVMYLDQHFTVIYLQTCVLCFSCYYFYIALSLYLYCCYIVYLDHHFTVVYLQTCVLCICLVITSTLFYLYTCTVAMWCIEIITLLLYTFRLVYSVFVLLLLLHCFIFILVLLLCCVSISSPHSNISSDLCTLCLSCYYFYIVLSLYLYCCNVVYPVHHFTVICLQTCVVCVCLVINSTLFYLYTCTVAMWCIKIITLL
jgi:hypothetical protein